MKIQNLNMVFVCLVGALGLGACAAYEEGGGAEASEDISSIDSEIIGGSAITVATRRSVGLIDVNGGCSGSLTRGDWVLTATHCLNLTTPSSNTFAAPRTDAGVDSRTGQTVIQVGTSDISLVRLNAAAAGNMWPNVTRNMRSAAASGLIGQTVTCYGRGNTTYVSPSGLTGFGNWRTLSKTVGGVDAFNNLTASATAAGSEITAPGDSGGLCVFGGLAASVTSWGTWQCADPSTDATCRATITKVTGAGWRATNDFANYIDQASNRTSTTFRPLTLINSWTNAPFATTNAGVALVNGVVQLRGAIATSGASAQPFVLPSGFRPSTTAYVPVNLCNSTKGRLLIQPTGDVTVQTLGAFSDAQCFTSLEGASFAVSNAGYTSLALQNGWTNAPFATRNAAVKNNSGVIQFQGAIASGTTGVAFTLPVGFRPSTNAYVPIDLCNSNKGRLFIQPSGVVTVQAETAFSEAQCFTSLEGASFVLATGGTALTLQNSWVNAPFATRNATFSNIGGIVRFQGAIASGTTGLAFTLPAAARPATDVYVPVDLCNATKGRILIQPSGAVSVQSQGAFSNAQCFTSLEGAAFGI